MFNKKRGMTLMEIIIALALISIILTTIVTCFTRGLRSYFHTIDLSFSLRNNYIGLEWISRELKCAEIFYSPEDSNFGITPLPPGGINEFSPAKGQTMPLVFKKITGDGASDYELIGYQMDKNAKIIQRIVYDNAGFDETDPLSWQVKQESGKNLIKTIASLELKDIFNYEEFKFKFDSEDISPKKNLLIISIKFSRKLPDGAKINFPIETEVRMKRP